MTFKYGPIKNPKTNETRPILVRSVFPAKLKDILISGVLMITGAGYMAWKSFKHGADGFDKGEWTTLQELGLLGDTDEDGMNYKDTYTITKTD